MIIFFLILFFLCWGSFLNVVAYRIIQNHSLLKARSFCPTCHETIAWYDLIPVLSWIILKGKCRTCSGSISFLYPFIEILTALVFTCLILFIEPSYWLAYSIFFSGLIITVRTDIETMYISRFIIWPLTVLGLLLSGLSLLPISITQSIAGALFGYGILWLIGSLFFVFKKQEGIGEGDYELLCAIGSFLGIQGAWLSLMIGATLGSLFALFALFKGATRSTKIPFGPWLSLGAIAYVFLRNYFPIFIKF